MNKYLLCVLIFSSAYVYGVSAQCSYPKPEIKGGKIILCPESTDTIFTSNLYDTYQWIKNGRAIPGATKRFYIVNAYDDAASLFKVAVSKNGCKDTSRRKLVDGYAFAGPITISQGELGIYDPFLGASIQCPGDTIKLTFGEPYTENIQWYNLGNPIPGANDQSYIVTKSGSYTVCGAPAVCPDYNVCQNVAVNYYYTNPTATITRKSDTLFASAAVKYQWYSFNRKIPGADKNYYVPKSSGVYSVYTTNKYTCTALSDLFVFTAALQQNIAIISPNPAHEFIHVRLQSSAVKQIIIADVYGVKRTSFTSPGTDMNISIHNLQPGIYYMQLMNGKKQLLSTLRFTKL